MTNDDGILERVEVVLADGTILGSADPDAAAICAAVLNRGGESCRVVFRFTDGSTAEVSHEVEDGVVKTRLSGGDWV